MTQLSNPKTAIVYAAVFAAFSPRLASLTFKLIAMGLVLIIETTWYSIVATMLSSDVSRAHYMKFKHWIDRVAGGVMIALGAKLIVSNK